jgi:hypothetical protein
MNFLKASAASTRMDSSSWIRHNEALIYSRLNVNDEGWDGRNLEGMVIYKVSSNTILNLFSRLHMLWSYTVIVASH